MALFLRLGPAIFHQPREQFLAFRPGAMARLYIDMPHSSRINKSAAPAFREVFGSLGGCVGIVVAAYQQ